MTLIKQKNAIDIFINGNDTISIVHPDVENLETGRTEDVIITIHPEDIDAVVNELLRLKKEFYDQKEEDLNNS